MAKYKDKWKTTFPTSIGNQTRPEDGVDNTQEYNTDGLPQYMANDPVRYDLQNAVNSQLVSNDERLNEKIKRTSDDLAAHNKDPKSHATGIAGNAATASKLLTPRTISLTGKAAGSATFDGSANAAINVTSVNADTASKLSSARKINITGNATGAAAFDGSGDININTTVNESKHAESAGTATALEIVTNRPADANAQYGDGKIRYFLSTSAMSKNKPPTGDGQIINLAWDNNGGYDAQLFVNNKTGRLNMRGQSAGKWSNWLIGLDSGNFNDYAPTKTGMGASGSWNINSATATKLATPRTISLTGNASGSATFDGSGNVSINTNVNNADKVDGYHESSFLRYRGDAAANGEDTYWDRIGIKRYEGKLPQGISGTYNYGGVVSLPAGAGARLDIWYNHHCSTNGDGLWYRSGYSTDKKAWARLLDSVNYTNYAPTKTGSGASGTWGINISGTAAKLQTARSIALTGNATGSATFDGSGNISISTNVNTATNADKLDGYHASDIISKIYPVGSIYMSMVATNPATLFGVGTWKRISQGRMLLGADDSTYKAGATGGEAAHTLSVNEMPAHSHGISNSGDHTHNFYGSDNNNGPLTEGDGLDTEGNSHFTHNVRFTTSSAGAHTHTISNSGGGAAHNNMPPYLVCYIWQRTA